MAMAAALAKEAASGSKKNEEYMVIMTDADRHENISQNKSKIHPVISWTYT